MKMETLIAFFIGLFLGGAAGAITLALMMINKEDPDGGY
jgi:gas vesicle protein